MVQATSRKSQALLTVLLSACSGINVIPVATDEDLKGPPEPLGEHVERCYKLPLAGAPTSPPGLGWGEARVCNATGGMLHGSVGVRTLTSFEIYGTGRSPTPPNHVRLVAPRGGSSFAYPSAQNYRSENTIRPIVSDGDWSIASSLIGNLNTCFPDCEWERLVVETQDEARAEDDDCADYVPTLEVCLHYTERSANRSAPMKSSCVPGHGSFTLVPRRILNKDGDSDFSVILSPMQILGTGRLTGAAWITSIDLVMDGEQTLRVLKPNVLFQFDSRDQLVDKTLNSIVLSETNHWPEGVISGGAPIVGEELPGETQAGFFADLAWTCGTVSLEEERHPSQGYIVDSEALGCFNPIKQLFTVRPVPSLAPTKLIWERYGHVEDRETTPLTSELVGHFFDVRLGDFRLRGHLSTYDAKGATLVIDEASSHGVAFCAPGRYFLPAER